MGIDYTASLFYGFEFSSDGEILVEITEDARKYFQLLDEDTAEDMLEKICSKYGKEIGYNTVGNSYSGYLDNYITFKYESSDIFGAQEIKFSEIEFVKLRDEAQNAKRFLNEHGIMVEEPKWYLGSSIW